MGENTNKILDGNSCLQMVSRTNLLDAYVRIIYCKGGNGLIESLIKLTGDDLAIYQAKAAALEGI